MKFKVKKVATIIFNFRALFTGYRFMNKNVELNIIKSPQLFLIGNWKGRQRTGVPYLIIAEF